MARFRKRRMSTGRMKRRLRSLLATVHESRVRFNEVSIPANTTTQFLLLLADDDPDYDLTSDGTNVAECQARSRLVSIRLHALMQPAGQTTPLEWMIYRNPDQANAQTPDALFQADVTSNILVLRKNALGYGWVKSNTNIEVKSVNIRIPRRTLRRVSVLSDNDRLQLAIRNSAAAATGVLTLWGTIKTSI